MKKMKLVLTSFVLLTLSFLNLESQAQSNWTLDQSVKGVEFYHQLTQCDGNTVVFLKFKNTTNQNVLITWNEVFGTQLKTGVSGWKGSKQLVLSPGTTLQANCTDLTHPECLVVSLDIAPTHKSLIRSFAFANITVAKAP